MFSLNIQTALWLFCSCLLFKADVFPLASHDPTVEPVAIPDHSSSAPVACDCTITQSGQSYAVSALQGTVNSVAYYSYGNPVGASANTGHEVQEGLVIFLYENTNTGIISLFLIADIGGDNTGGEMEFEITCLPATAYVSVEDDPGEFSGVPPVITGDWTWAACCTDGGVIEDIGCNNTINLDLLLSTGIDSILWLTGDINNPDQILLGLTGEAITISCGSGGICCPLGLDTEVTVVDATCPDTPNGSINLSPQDGFPGYFYEWSNGETDQNLTGLIPGVYSVTVTDSQGCTEEIDITVDVVPGDPDADPASLELCSETDMAVFDLTSVNDIVNLGLGFDVFWFEDSNLNILIPDPTNYLSGTGTVYAVVDNGFCYSEPVPVELTVIQSPMGTATTVNLCEEMDDMATFDLTSLDPTVSGGAGNVIWYEDPALSILISVPEAFYTGSTIVYAVVDDGTCQSEPVEVELIVDPKPEGDSVSAEMCGDENDEAVFDLISLENDISMGNGVVEWYLEFELLDPIFFPGAFLTPTTTVYAVVFDGICYSDPIPIPLTVHPTPVGNPLSIQACDEGSGIGLFNLTEFDALVSGGEGIVNWYLDEFLTELISNPEAFLSESTTIFATVENEFCISAYVQIELLVIQSPAGNDIDIETCADSTGMGVFDLTATELEITGGSGIVQWYEDDMGQFPIATPSAFVSTGQIVYAQITLGSCISEFIPIELILINSVTATPASLAACDDGTGNAVFNLVTIADSVSGGSGQVNWYLDMEGLMTLPNPSAFYSGDSTVYARVVAGDCASDIVPVELMVIPSPVAIDTLFTFCGDTNGLTTIDLTTLENLISQGLGDVSWFSDIGLQNSISNAQSFMAGDTVIYATVFNGSCYSPAAVITLDILDGLVATPAVVQVCIPAGDTLQIDLTQWNLDIDSNLQVNWFEDLMAFNPIPTPDAYAISNSDTVYVNISNADCISPTIAIPIDVLTAPEGMSTDIKKCGDMNGEVTVDLTTVESIVSGNVGTVTWYADPGQAIPLANPGMLVTGDTTIYALITNGFCVSPVVPVTVTVVDSLVAEPQLIEVCLLDADTAHLDLTQYNPVISGGSGPVIWFTDIQMMDTIFDPSSFMTTGDSLYAIVTADGCTSDPALVEISVATSSYPELDCAFTSIDSISITWPNTADQYEVTYLVNGLPVGAPVTGPFNVFTLGGLDQNDSITLSVTSLYNAICTTPLTTTITCATDICPSQTITFNGLTSEYCRDITSIPLDISPAGGIISGSGVVGDTLYPAMVAGATSTIMYTWEESVSGCVYDTVVLVSFFDPLATPVLNCTSDTISAVSFSWDNTSDMYGYYYSINQGIPGTVVTDNSTSLIVDGLNEGDEVTLTLWGIGPPPCGNSDTIEVSCNSKSCPPATITISDPGKFCSGDDPIQLEAMTMGLSGMETLTWSGPGISDPSGIFDPQSAMFGNNAISLAIEDQGCPYDAGIDIFVRQQPVADFDIFGIRCINKPSTVEFFGIASDSATFNYDLDGADIITGSLPYNFSIAWSTPGTYTISLIVDDHGCVSNTLSLTLDIDEPLVAPEIICVEEDYHSITVEWDPVPGAVSYEVSSSSGTGELNGTTYTITNLRDDSPVTITVRPVGDNACASVSSTVECHTLAYIPANIFIPNVFSPNDDGINDVFFIQSNEEVALVYTFRIFDRWGSLMFEDFEFQANDPEHGWDGTLKGEDMNPGVFTYVAEVLTSRGDTRLISGDVTLVR